MNPLEDEKNEMEESNIEKKQEWTYPSVVHLDYLFYHHST